jgi:L-asparagine transporter-like permease
VPAKAFAYITSIATVCGLFVWAMVMVGHMRYRQVVKSGRLPEGKFRMPISPLGDWIVLAFLALVTVLMACNSSTRIGLYVAPAWVAALVIGYFASRKHHIRLTPASAPARQLEFLGQPVLAEEPQIADDHERVGESTNGRVKVHA